jgi:hypothetical protein
MVVFSLQTFINTFFYVQSSGRARRAAPTGQPRRTEEVDGHSAPWLEGRSARLSASHGYQLLPNGRKGGHPRGAADTRRLDT